MKDPREMKYYGLHACMAIWKKRPQDIVRIYLDPIHLQALRSLLKWCAENKKAYHLVQADELASISDSVHHEGICILAKKPKQIAPLLPKEGKACLLYLDGVQNPHNLGAILRSAAHFALSGIAGTKESLPTLSPSCCRIAMGGAEEVPLFALEQPISWLKKNGCAIVATSSHKGDSLYNFRFPPRSALIFGSETDGVSKTLFKQADHLIRIPGSGSIESLNVSVAAALSMSEYYRQHRL